VEDVQKDAMTPEAPMKPDTTSEQDKHSLGQRRINMIWEITQASIALSIIWGSVGASIWMIVSDPLNRLMSFLFLSNVVSIVIGFYFGRTNHQRVGGVDLGR
jgi:hypothetical protein